MPIFEFCCLSCNREYEVLTSYDETEKYKGVKCEHCGSKKKDKLVSKFNFNFTNVIGTDRWNNSHDYRFKHNIPNVKKEREMAEAASHMGSSPYHNVDDLPLDTGVHDNEENIKLMV